MKRAIQLQDLQGPGATGAGWSFPREKRDVYIVCFGEYMDGHTPKRVFSSLKKAKKYALRDWQTVVVLLAHGLWRGEVPDSRDEVWIYRMRVWDE